MVESTSYGTDGGGGRDRYSIETTVPPAILRHDISDEQLEMLTNARRDGIAEAIWALFGAAIGAFPSGADALIRAYWAKTDPLSVLGLVNVMITGVGLALFVGGIVISNKRGKRGRDLVKEIRARTKSLAS